MDVDEVPGFAGLGPRTLSSPIAVQPAAAPSEVMRHDRNDVAAFEPLNIAKHDPHYYVWQVEGNQNAWFDLEKDIAKRFEEGVNGMGDVVLEVLRSDNKTKYIYNTRDKFQLNVKSGTRRLVRRLLISHKHVVENVLHAANVKRLNASKTSVSSRTA